MKKTKLFFLGILVCLCLSSCQKDDLYYSCDEIVNNWTEDNIASVQTMTRAQWLDINDYEFQKATYAALPSKGKHDFWIQKLHEVLELDWSQREMDHLFLLLDFLHNRPFLFDKDYYHDDQRLNDCSLFEYKWQDYAINELKWNKNIIYAILGTGERMQTKNGGIAGQSLSNVSSLIKTRSESDGGGTGKVCTCSQYQDFCDLTGEFQQACRNNVGLPCDVNPKNCGWWMNKDCDGNCRHAWIN